MSESDSIEKFLEKFKSIQAKFLDFLEDDENIDEKFQNLNKIFEDTKIRDCQHEVRQFLHLLLKVANNHHHTPNFFNKIDRILQLFKEDIKKYQNEEIFRLFKSNKRILLFLIEEKIFTVDEYFVKQIINKKYSLKKYPQYFSPEIKPFLNEKWFPKHDPNDKDFDVNNLVEEIKKELPENFYEMRKIGENENHLCKLIRDDSSVEFIAYVNRNNIPLDKTIPLSIYETNSFLIKRKENTKLIDYAAFFGSIEIFTFLKYEKVELTPSLWLDAVHSKKAELIHLLEENNVVPIITAIRDHKKIEEKSYKECFFESIKCHHNDIANYFLNNHPHDEDENSKENMIKSLEYYNFAFCKKEAINESLFCHLCHYNYYLLVKVFLANYNVDINTKAIQNLILQYNSKSNLSIIFKIISFNEIQNHIFQLYLKSFLPI